MDAFPRWLELFESSPRDQPEQMVLVETATRLHLRLIELDKLLMSCCQEQFTEEQRGFCISEIEGVARDIREIVDVLVDIKIKRERPDEFPAAERPTEKAGMLSLDHIRSVYTGIELLWQCSLKHFVEMHLPFYTEMDLLHPKALVLTKEAMTRISSIGTDMSDKDRWGIHTTITDVAFLYTFCNTMNKRFVRRVIAFQLLTSRLNPGWTEWCDAYCYRNEFYLLTVEFEVQGSELLDRSLHGLIDEECFRNYVVAVKSLIHMAGSTQCVWLMQMCGRLLGEFISTHRGLKFVLQGYLDGTLPTSTANPRWTLSINTGHDHDYMLLQEPFQTATPQWSKRRWPSRSPQFPQGCPKWTTLRVFALSYYNCF